MTEKLRLILSAYIEHKYPTDTEILHYLLQDRYEIKDLLHAIIDGRVKFSDSYDALKKLYKTYKENENENNA